MAKGPGDPFFCFFGRAGVEVRTALAGSPAALFSADFVERGMSDPGKWKAGEEYRQLHMRASQSPLDTGRSYLTAGSMSLARHGFWQRVSKKAPKRNKIIFVSRIERKFSGLQRFLLILKLSFGPRKIIFQNLK
ncbi:hypothetical protein PQU92_14040 [Asticcacaulis sp. BYS171W]|uniref:Uncharacterized protein n=1 Tax=Asticcacaulis aquaticus TaxID=2984212 RepID=A0ABT5HWH2_9CAUL|nr:hypothetical protein [Asticcacaulis aquaticus]MDC7684403.1 hypothetical protein [Asticcacaulis aquaticus]